LLINKWPFNQHGSQQPSKKKKKKKKKERQIHFLATWGFLLEILIKHQKFIGFLSFSVSQSGVFSVLGLLFYSKKKKD